MRSDPLSDPLRGSSRTRTHPSLKRRLGIGAALIGGSAILAALVLFIAMARVTDRLDAALAAEQRIARYSALSTQVSTLLVISTEAVQTGLAPDLRASRILRVADTIRSTFTALKSDLERAVIDAEQLGIDQQSRFGTQSLGLARMEAQLNTLMTGLTRPGSDKDILRAEIDTFVAGFEPLLAQAVNSEVLLRTEILNGIANLRWALSWLALAIAVLAALLVLGFYLGLVRPQFHRLDRLRHAAQQITDQDFDLQLPDTQRDEIGTLYAETNRMASALSARKAEVMAEWDRLSETVDQRTRELRSANARLAEVDANRRRFFADVSHELRTPLTVIMMEAQLGQQGGPEPAQAFATIETRARRLNRRIDDLLRVARSDSGELALEPQAVDLAQIVAEAQAEVTAEISNAGMVMAVDEIPEVTVTADPNWLRQIIVGLVRNAIRHARDGGQVRIIQIATPEMAGIGVLDNGPGIPEQDQALVFQRWSQGETQAQSPTGGQKSQGFGIGLALARWVIETLHGKIRLDSPVSETMSLGENPGTGISVLLPLAQDTPKDTAKDAPQTSDR